MKYGFEFINNNDVVTVDSEFARLSIVSSGRFTWNQQSNLVATTMFSRTITTVEAPLVFIKPDRANMVAGFCQFRMIGSPGAWTGFSVRGYDVNTARPNGEYFAAAWQSAAVAQYGARLFDGDEKVIFDTGMPFVNFTRAYEGWTYVTSGRDAQGLTMVYFSLPFDFNSNEFMLINNFSMKMMGAQYGTVDLYCWWDFPSNKLWAITVGTTNMNSMFLPAVFAKKQV